MIDSGATRTCGAATAGAAAGETGERCHRKIEATAATSSEGLLYKRTTAAAADRSGARKLGCTGMCVEVCTRVARVWFNS